MYFRKKNANDSLRNEMKVSGFCDIFLVIFFFFNLFSFEDL